MTMHPLESLEGQRALFLLDAAGNDAEWRLALSNLMRMVLAAWAGCNVPPSLAAMARWREQAEQLCGQITKGPDFGPGRPVAVWQRAMDGFYLGFADVTFARAARLLAKAEGIPESTARHRIEAAEAFAGVTLPRRRRTRPNPNWQDDDAPRIAAR